MLKILELCGLSIVISVVAGWIGAKVLIFIQFGIWSVPKVWEWEKSTKQWLAQKEKERKEDEALRIELEADPRKRKRVLDVLKAMYEAGYFHNGTH